MSRCAPREMLVVDLPGVVELHRHCFPDYFLTGLGPGALYCFYAAAVKDPRTVAAVLVEQSRGDIVGLVVGTLNPAFHTRLLRRNFDRFAIGLLRGLFTSKTEARLLDVATHANWRGGRNAEILVDFFVDRMLHVGAGRVGATVRPDNIGSLILYKRLGWNTMRTGPERIDVWLDRPA